MPELPEVETIARQLNATLAGRALGAVVHVRADMVHGSDRPLRDALPGTVVERVYRRAKRIIFELERRSDGATKRRRKKATKRRSDVATQGRDAGIEGHSGEMSQLIVHLGMTGRLTVCDASEPVEKHTHLRVALAGGGQELRFRDPLRVGGIWLVADANSETSKRRNAETPKSGATALATKRRSNVATKGKGKSPNRQITKSPNTRGLGPLGPEPLELTATAFREVLARKRQIKALLMDQTAIAGLGNIYCDEALHAAGVHPLTRADEISSENAGRLLRAIKSVLRRAIRFQGSTLMDYRSADGEPGSFQRYHRVYGREGEPCRTCRTPIERIQVGGRSTHFCPRCQVPS